VYSEGVRRPGPAELLAAVALAAAVAPVHSAEAQRKKKKAPVGRKVHIETVPAGASVFVGDKESGPAGTTPIDLTLPHGEQVVILELDGYLPRFETLIVEDGGKDAPALTFAYELDLAKATLVVEPEGPLPDGTKVLVDGVEQGEPPVRLEVDVGAHQVQLVSPGKQPYEEWVEVEGGQEHVMTIAASALTGQVETPSPGAPRKKKEAGPIGTVRTGVEIGFRRFRYENPETPNLRPYDANGSAHVLIDAEIHPWRRWMPSAFFDRFSLLAGAGYSPVITATDNAGMIVKGYWRSQHAGLRFRALDRKVAVDVDAGWAHTLYTFRDENNALLDDVPDVDYQMVRFGLRVLGKVGSSAEVWAGVDNRVVLSAGLLEERFEGRADIDGFDARAGFAVWLLSQHLEGRVEGHYTRFGWTFESDIMDEYRADGGTDALFGVTITVGGRY
jgi:hypothetical protein